MKLRSRILEYFSKDLLAEIYNVTTDVTIPDNNSKADIIINILNKYDVDFDELGLGTNRMSIFIDSYVFKIAFDRDGIHDNWREFIMSKELQPLVSKTYECNGLIAVAEYVVLISKEEFTLEENKESVKSILSILADSYLLGDVGSVAKNFTNWGYRSNGELVILDYAYIYRVIGDEMICKNLKDGHRCDGVLQYDDNFFKLFCPKCRTKYTFHQIRNRIDKTFEAKELELIKDRMAYKLTQSVQEVKEYEEIDDDDEIEVEETREADDMKDFINTKLDEDKDPTELYMDALEFMFNQKEEGEFSEDEPADVVINEEVEEDTIESLTPDEDEFEEIPDDIPEFYTDEEDEEESTIIDSVDTENSSDDIDMLETTDVYITDDTEDTIDEDPITVTFVEPEIEMVPEEEDESKEVNVTVVVDDNPIIDIEVPVEETVHVDINVSEPETIEEDVDKYAAIVNEGVTMKFYEADEEMNEDDMRLELESDIMGSDDEEYDDEYDSEYDDIINDKMNRKYSNKNKGGM